MQKLPWTWGSAQMKFSFSGSRFTLGCPEAEFHPGWKPCFSAKVWRSSGLGVSQVPMSCCGTGAWLGDTSTGDGGAASARVPIAAGTAGAGLVWCRFVGEGEKASFYRAHCSGRLFIPWERGVHVHTLLTGEKREVMQNSGCYQEITSTMWNKFVRCSKGLRLCPRCQGVELWLDSNPCAGGAAMYKQPQ